MPIKWINQSRQTGRVLKRYDKRYNNFYNNIHELININWIIFFKNFVFLLVKFTNRKTFFFYPFK